MGCRGAGRLARRVPSVITEVGHQPMAVLFPGLLRPAARWQPLSTVRASSLTSGETGYLKSETWPPRRAPGTQAWAPIQPPEGGASWDPPLGVGTSGLCRHLRTPTSSRPLLGLNDLCGAGRDLGTLPSRTLAVSGSGCSRGRWPCPGGDSAGTVPAPLAHWALPFRPCLMLGVGICGGSSSFCCGLGGLGHCGALAGVPVAAGTLPCGGSGTHLCVSGFRLARITW